MQLIAVPVKCLPDAKRRLASLLSADERAAIVLAMLEDVLDACVRQPGWEVWVVSPDETVRRAAARRGARAMADEGGSLLRAVRLVEDELSPAEPLAVVLADLPLVTAVSLGDALATDAEVVAAPATSDGGTNVLVRRPAHVIPARFGRASFAKHRWEARHARVGFAEAASHELAFDLDRPSDVARLLATDRASRARSTCLDIGLGERLRMRA